MNVARDISATSNSNDLIIRAKLEFREELAVEPASNNWIELGTVKQKGGKTVHAWAFEGDLPTDFVVVCNSFALEWPPRSGRSQDFPEIDRAEFFPIELAKEKINPAQIAFLDRLLAILQTR